MKPRVYIETTILSYLTARTPKDVIALARQKITKDWWENRSIDFDLVTSRLTELEISRGDAAAAARRQAAIKDITLISHDERVAPLAARFIEANTIPAKAADDAVHLSICAVNAIPFLLTWNFRHLANVNIRLELDFLCASAGYRLPQICTPEEL
jgi:hypothetical protein